MREHRNALFSSYMIIALASLSFVHLPKLLKPGSWHITLKLFWRRLASQLPGTNEPCGQLPLLIAQ
ncbi:hypothetical protein I7I48_02226 [Histoplasma ohiense]|nr:hypothetical protein I7I48_02226 [Histoplasma ohiense (nom. inval.)]